MTPVVAISKPAIVAATIDMGIIIFDSDSCSPSCFLRSELGLGISAVVASVSEKAVDSLSVGCTPVDSEKNAALNKLHLACYHRLKMFTYNCID